MDNPFDKAAARARTEEERRRSDSFESQRLTNDLFAALEGYRSHFSAAGIGFFKGKLRKDPRRSFIALCANVPKHELDLLLRQAGLTAPRRRFNVIEHEGIRGFIAHGGVIKKSEWNSKTREWEANYLEKALGQNVQEAIESLAEYVVKSQLPAIGDARDRITYQDELPTERQREINLQSNLPVPKSSGSSTDFIPRVLTSVFLALILAVPLHWTVGEPISNIFFFVAFAVLFWLLG